MRLCTDSYVFARQEKCSGPGLAEAAGPVPVFLIAVIHSVVCLNGLNFIESEL